MASRVSVRCSAPRMVAAAGARAACLTASATSTPSPAADDNCPSPSPRSEGQRKARMTNSMKQKLAAGELVLCMNLRLARTVDIAMVAQAGGYDALYVDMEHSPYSIDTTATICAAALGI